MSLSPRSWPEREDDWTGESAAEPRNMRCLLDKGLGGCGFETAHVRLLIRMPAVLLLSAQAIPKSSCS